MDNQKNVNLYKSRNSNIELLRILMMIMIIAHHYVVNSGITEMYDFNNITGNMIFLQIFGFSGKTMINGFLLISGYFMVKHKTSLKKIIRLFFQIKFYVFVIYIIMIIIGIETLSIKSVLSAIFSLIKNVNVGFTATFFLLYIIMPFLNRFVMSIDRKQYIFLLVILFFFYTLIPTFFIVNDTFNEIGWYITVYLYGAYIRLYMDDLKLSGKQSLIIIVINIALIIASILCLDYLNYNPYHMVTNANKLFAVTLSISLFFIFKNLHMGYNKVVNMLAQATFGVLLIHANSNAMREFLWVKLLNVTSLYESDYLVFHAIISVLAIYTICSVIELLRIKFIEKPFLNYICNTKIYHKANNFFNLLWN